MAEHPIDQSIKGRAWEDTIKSRHSPWCWLGEVAVTGGFIYLGTVLAPEGASRFVSAAYQVGGFMLGALVGFAIIYLAKLIKAPIKQRNEVRSRLSALEKEKEPCIEVHPVPGRRPDYERHDKTAWAALQITNTSTGVNLENVTVQIAELMYVYERPDEQGKGTGIYSLHELYPRWSPANVYWSERNALPNQLKMPIPRGAAETAIIAFHREKGPALGILNTPQYPHMQESRIVIAISSPSMNTWRGVYYIEYVPPRQDKFEFIEWDLWCKSHNVIEQSASRNGDSKP